MKKNFVIIIFLLLAINTITAQSKDINLLYIDTIRIEHPLLIRFKEYDNTDSSVVQSVLASVEHMKSIKVRDSTMNFFKFLSSQNCYLFFTATRFYCLLSDIDKESLNKNDSTLFATLESRLINAEKDIVWAYVDKTNYKPEFFNGYEFNDIYPKRFMLFLVNGSALVKCQSIDEIVLRNCDNLYFKILVPITW